MCAVAKKNVVGAIVNEVKSILLIVIGIGAASSLGGCSSFGLFVPEMQEFYQTKEDDERID
jgi:hypothetical protein